MGSENESSAAPARARATTTRAIGTIAAIAVIAAALVVGWARIGDAGSSGDEDEPGGDAIPTTLEGGIEPGEVPRALARAFDKPVVAATLLTQLPPDVLDTCQSSDDLEWEEGDPTLESAVATPDAVHASLIGRSVGMGEQMGFESTDGEPVRWRVRCTARFEDGGWRTDGSGGFEPADEGFEHTGIQEMSCCDAAGMTTGTAILAAPPEAAWAVQDRGSWYLAYPIAEEHRRVTVTARFREGGFGRGGPPAMRVTYVDKAGEVIGEESLGDDF